MGGNRRNVRRKRRVRPPKEGVPQKKKCAPFNQIPKSAAEGKLESPPLQKDYERVRYDFDGKQCFKDYPILDLDAEFGKAYSSFPEYWKNKEIISARHPSTVQFEVTDEEMGDENFFDKKANEILQSTNGGCRLVKLNSEAAAEVEKNIDKKLRNRENRFTENVKLVTWKKSHRMGNVDWCEPDMEDDVKTLKKVDLLAYSQFQDNMWKGIISTKEEIDHVFKKERNNKNSTKLTKPQKTRQAKKPTTAQKKKQAEKLRKAQEMRQAKKPTTAQEKKQAEKLGKAQEIRQAKKPTTPQEKKQMKADERNARIKVANEECQKIYKKNVSDNGSVEKESDQDFMRRESLNCFTALKESPINTTVKYAYVPCENRHQKLVEGEDKLLGVHMSDIGNISKAIIEGDGITKPYYYFGSTLSYFTWHVEDYNLNSINMHIYGKPKVWLVISPKYFRIFLKKLHDYIVENNPGRQIKDCSTLHKNFMVHPELLYEWRIPFEVVYQEVGTILLLKSGAWHGGFNTGLNCAIAQNMMYDDFFESILNEDHLDILRCTCKGDCLGKRPCQFFCPFQWEMMRSIALHRNDPEPLIDAFLIVPMEENEFRQKRIRTRINRLEQKNKLLGDRLGELGKKGSPEWMLTVLSCVSNETLYNFSKTAPSLFTHTADFMLKIAIIAEKIHRRYVELDAFTIFSNIVLMAEGTIEMPNDRFKDQQQQQPQLGNLTVSTAQFFDQLDVQDSFIINHSDKTDDQQHKQQNQDLNNPESSHYDQDFMVPIITSEGGSDEYNKTQQQQHQINRADLPTEYVKGMGQFDEGNFDTGDSNTSQENLLSQAVEEPASIEPSNENDTESSLLQSVSRPTAEDSQNVSVDPTNKKVVDREELNVCDKISSYTYDMQISESANGESVNLEHSSIIKEFTISSTTSAYTGQEREADEDNNYTQHQQHHEEGESSNKEKVNSTVQEYVSVTPPASLPLHEQISSSSGQVSNDMMEVPSSNDTNKNNESHFLALVTSPNAQVQQELTVSLQTGTPASLPLHEQLSSSSGQDSNDMMEVPSSNDKIKNNESHFLALVPSPNAQVQQELTISLQSGTGNGIGIILDNDRPHHYNQKQQSRVSGDGNETESLPQTSSTETGNEKSKTNKLRRKYKQINKNYSGIDRNKDHFVTSFIPRKEYNDKTNRTRIYYTCACGSVFASMDTLRRHIKEGKSTKGMYVCDKGSCDNKNFAHARSLARHMKVKHKMVKVGDHYEKIKKKKIKND